MTKEEVLSITEKVYHRIIHHYGLSKYKETNPYVSIEQSPYSDADVDPDTYGEYCWMMNEIVIYWKNIDSLEMLTRTLVHEYQHYLQWKTQFTFTIQGN